jgi:O-antigen/teichoic acid export membrane protein
MSSHAHKIASGILWSSLHLCFSKAFSYLVILGLAKALAPEAFGLVGMATVFTGLMIAIGNASITAALIQLRETQLTQCHYDSLRTLVFAANFIIALAYILIVAPFAAWFYGEPALSAIIPVLALQSLIGAFNVIPRAQLSRQMDFKRLAYAESFGAVAAGVVTLLLAAAGFGIWSLVAQTLLLEAFQVPLLRKFAKDNGHFSWSSDKLRQVRRFVTFDSLNRGFVFFSKNIDYLLVGKLLGSQALGVYTLAFMLTDLVRSQIMNLLNRVMFPVYGQLQDNRAAVKEYYLKVVRYNTLVLGPIMLLFILFAESWVPILLGPEWSGAVFPMQAMAISSLIHAFGGTTDSVLKAIGKVDLVFKIHLWKTALITIPAFSLGIHYYGIEGAAVAVVIHKLAGRIIYQFSMHKYLEIRYRDVFRAAAPLFPGLLVSCMVHLCFGAIPITDSTASLLGQTLIIFALAIALPLYFVWKEITLFLKPEKPITDPA